MTKQRIRTIGALVWIFAIQYYVVQYLVGLSWQTPYSLRLNTISDLGNTYCGNYGSRYVCSSHPAIMNLSFITLGATMIIGAFLLLMHNKDVIVRLACGGFILSGIGTIMVGLFPENTISALHITGAGLPFVLGNISIMLFALRLTMPKWLKICTLTFGIIALIALPCFMTDTTLGLGTGGIERIVAYPQSIWMIIYAGWYLRYKYRSSHVAHSEYKF